MYVTLGHFVSLVYCQTGSPSYGYVVMCRLMLSFTGSEKKSEKNVPQGKNDELKF